MWTKGVLWAPLVLFYFISWRLHRGWTGWVHQFGPNCPLQWSPSVLVSRTVVGWRSLRELMNHWKDDPNLKLPTAKMKVAFAICSVIIVKTMKLQVQVTLPIRKCLVFVFWVPSIKWGISDSQSSCLEFPLSNMLKSECIDFCLIHDNDKWQLLWQDGPAYIRVFVSILRDIFKEETVEYVLALIDEMLTGNWKSL